MIKYEILKLQPHVIGPGVCDIARLVRRHHTSFQKLLLLLLLLLLMMMMMMLLLLMMMTMMMMMNFIRRSVSLLMLYRTQAVQQPQHTLWSNGFDDSRDYVLDDLTSDIDDLT